MSGMVWTRAGLVVGTVLLGTALAFLDATVRSCAPQSGTMSIGGCETRDVLRTERAAADRILASVRGSLGDAQSADARLADALGDERRRLAALKGRLTLLVTQLDEARDRQMSVDVVHLSVDLAQVRAFEMRTAALADELVKSEQASWDLLGRARFELSK